MTDEIRYVYSLNDELYYELEDILNQIAECDDVINIYRGERVNYSIEQFIDGSSILEDIAQSIHEDIDEYGEDYCYRLDNIPKYKIKELEVIISNFITQEIGDPTFYSVKNAVKIQVKDIQGNGTLEKY